MIGIVLVTHGRLAYEMLNVAQHVVGPQKGVECVGINPDDDMELKRHEILEKTAAVDTGDGVIVITDMFGGTPSNLAISLMEEGKVEVISGVNLPMLVKLVRMRKKSLSDAVMAAAESGQHYIMVASKFLGAKK